MRSTYAAAQQVNIPSTSVAFDPKVRFQTVFAGAPLPLGEGLAALSGVFCDFAAPSDLVTGSAVGEAG